MSEIAIEYRRDRESVNTHPPLTHSLDYGKEQAVKQHTGEIGKVCTKCNEDKPFSEYNKRKSSKDGHYNDCKSCQSAYKRAHYEANRERLLAEKKEYYEANREKISDYGKSRYESKKDDILSKNKAYYEANRDKVIAQVGAYQAEKFANDPKFRAQKYARYNRRYRLIASAKSEPYLREDIFERDNWTCGICQEPIDQNLQWPERGSASIDHVIPVSHGGDDTPDNVQAAHLGCNAGRGNRVELEDLQTA